MVCINSKPLSCVLFQIYLGDAPTQIFCETAVQDIIRQFRDRLAVISDEIRERNKYLEVPYTFLSPERVPNSITI